MLSINLSSFMNQFVNGFFSLLFDFLSYTRTTTVFVVSSTPITLFDILVGLCVLEIVFGLFLFVSPRLKGGV